MEWPEDLLDILNEPFFDNVQLLTPRATIDDRLKQAFQEINDWYQEHNKEPQIDAPRPERGYANNLKGIRATAWKREALKPMDIYHLLDNDNE